MVAEFTDRHVGKRVVDQNGVEVGAVAEVRNGSLYVEVGSDADPETIDELNWDEGPVHRDTHRLNDGLISDITDDVVRLNV